MPSGQHLGSSRLRYRYENHETWNTGRNNLFQKEKNHNQDSEVHELKGRLK